MRFKSVQERNDAFFRDFRAFLNRGVNAGQHTKSMRLAVEMKELEIVPDWIYGSLFEQYYGELNTSAPAMIRVSQTTRYRDTTLYKRPSGQIGLVIPVMGCLYYSWFVPVK